MESRKVHGSVACLAGPHKGLGCGRFGTSIWTLTPAGADQRPAKPRPTPSTPAKRPAKKPDPAPRLEITLALEQFTRGRTAAPMQFCSVGAHPYLDGVTPFLGRVAVRGMPGDSLESLELQILRGGRVRARAQLTAEMQAHFLREFPRSGTLAIGHNNKVPRWLFAMPSAGTASLVTKGDSNVQLRVHARSANGAEATLSCGTIGSVGRRRERSAKRCGSRRPGPSGPAPSRDPTRPARSEHR